MLTDASLIKFMSNIWEGGGSSVIMTNASYSVFLANQLSRQLLVRFEKAQQQKQKKIFQLLSVYETVNLEQVVP